jgi:hypothetical protein
LLINPLIAVLADRKEIDSQADWFILAAMSRDCRHPADQLCGMWTRMNAAARSGKVAVVGVDANVVSFDPAFRHDTGANRDRLIFRSKPAPFQSELYSSQRSGRRVQVKYREAANH